MSNKIAQAVFKLNTGYTIPLIGLGTYQIHGDEVFKSIDLSLNAGYRHIGKKSLWPQ